MFLGRKEEQKRRQCMWSSGQLVAVVCGADEVEEVTGYFLVKLG